MIKININLIKQKVAELNLSAAGLSRLSELSIATIMRIIKCENFNYNSHMIYKIAEVLDLRIENIIEKKS